MEVDKIIEKEIPNILKRHNQGHIENQIKKLLENIIGDNYAEQDIINLIEGILYEQKEEVK